jgi:gustatory receptor
MKVISELIMFYGFGMIRVYIFLYLATQWKEIMEFWYMKERALLYETYPMPKGWSMSKKFHIMGFVFMFLYLSEHLTFIGMQIHANQVQLDECNVTDITPLNNYMRRLRPHILDVLPYRWWIYPFFQWTITLMAFGWNYVDYFIIILSIGLSTRFNQVNERLKRTRHDDMNHKFWNDIRVDYCNLVDLLRYVDGKVAMLVLLSLLHNLFLLCTKIFEAIK